MAGARSTVELLRRLVAFDTVSAKPNVELIDWAAQRLEDAGFRCFVQHGDEAGKANLFATVGPDDVAGWMLSGHSDVVPVSGQDWSSDPFVLREQDGRLHARGAADMKGFLACVLDAAPRLAARRLRAPLHVVFSYDEETTMRGMRTLAAHLADAPLLPAACIIGEPTSMQLVVANKGAAGYRVHVRGHSVHSSLRDRGVSAVEQAAQIIVFIGELQRELDAAARHDGFEYPHTSVHVGRIEGGTAHNITAKDCEFVLEIRTLPGVRSAEVLERVRRHCDEVVLPAMRRIAADTSIFFDEIFDTPPLDERGNRSLAQAVAPLCEHPEARRVSFGTEAGILQAIGIPTVVCGPGDIAVAHQPDEYVETAQLERCSVFLDALGRRLSEDARD
ncbi:MAG: acetylornithine deacetylase [Burkholderiaceae bacterium]|nr:acetylornithine deacetylase [Burkholderiaceae bacterium]